MPTNNPRVSPTQCTGMTATCSPITSTSSTCYVDGDNQQDSSIYARAWRFVQRRLHLRPRAWSCPADMVTTKTVEDPPMTSSADTNSVASSYCCDWQRVHMLKELETAQYQECIKETAAWRAQPTFRTQAQRKAAQIKCYNCGLLFFRPLSVAPDTSAFCGRDCQSTFEYRRDLQDAVNECETFRATVNWTRSSEL